MSFGLLKSFKSILKVVDFFLVLGNSSFWDIKYLELYLILIIKKLFLESTLIFQLKNVIYYIEVNQSNVM